MQGAADLGAGRPLLARKRKVLDQMARNILLRRREV